METTSIPGNTFLFFGGCYIYVCSLAIFVDDHIQRIKCWLKTHIPPSDPGVARMDGMFIVGVLSNRPAAQSWSKGDPQGTSTYLEVTTMIFTDKTLDLSVTYGRLKLGYPEKLINVILLSWNPLFWIVSGDIHQFRTHPNPLLSS